jgi:hypothetical protein
VNRTIAFLTGILFVSLFPSSLLAQNSLDQWVAKVIPQDQSRFSGLTGGIVDIQSDAQNFYLATMGGVAAVDIATGRTRHWTANSSGMGSNSVNSLFVDNSTKKLYVATDVLSSEFSGLSQIDPSNIAGTSYAELAGKSVKIVVGDKEGNIYAVTVGNKSELWIKKADEMNFRQFNATRPSCYDGNAYIQSARVISNGDLYIYSHRGFCKSSDNGQTFESLTMPSYSTSNITSFSISDDGQTIFWLPYAGDSSASTEIPQLSRDGGLTYKYAPIKYEGVEYDPTHAIFDQNGDLLISAGENFEWSRKRKIFRLSKDNQLSLLKEGLYYQMNINTTGCVAAATRTDFSYACSDREFTPLQIAEETALGSYSAEDVAVSSTGSIAVTARTSYYGGEIFFAENRDAPFRKLFQSSSSIDHRARRLLKESTNNIYADAKGNFYISTRASMIVYNSQNNSTSTIQSYSEGPVSKGFVGESYGAYVDENDVLYIVSRSSKYGLSISKDHGKTFYQPKGLGDANDVLTDIQVRNGIIYAATAKGFAISTDLGESFATTPVSSSFPGRGMRRMAVVDQNTVLITGKEGVYLSKDKGASFSLILETKGSNSSSGPVVTIQRN